jgi:hypothetical protein
MAVRLSVLRTRRTLLPRNIIFYVSGTNLSYRLSEPQGLVRSEGLGKLKKKISSGIEPATFRFVAQCLNHYANACPQLHNGNDN